MGLRDDGDDPVTLAQTGCPCARGQGSDHDFVALVVPGSAGFEAQFDLVGMRTFDLTGPVKRREERHGFKCEELVVSPKGLPGRGVPERDDEPIYTVPGKPDTLVLGSRCSWDTTGLRIILNPKVLSLANFSG